jgi:hypothetical protein
MWPALRIGAKHSPPNAPGFHKMGNGAPERIRTSDPQIRSLVLYPAELRARCEGCITPLRRAMQGGSVADLC